MCVCVCGGVGGEGEGEGEERERERSATCTVESFRVGEDQSNARFSARCESMYETLHAKLH